MSDAWTQPDKAAAMLDLKIGQRAVALVNGFDAAQQIGDPWVEPTPLPDVLPAGQPFVVDLLPEKLRPWVMDVAHRMQCPPTSQPWAPP